MKHFTNQLYKTLAIALVILSMLLAPSSSLQAATYTGAPRAEYTYEPSGNNSTVWGSLGWIEMPYDGITVDFYNNQNKISWLAVSATWLPTSYANCRSSDTTNMIAVRTGWWQKYDYGQTDGMVDFLKLMAAFTTFFGSIEVHLYEPWSAMSRYEVDVETPTGMAVTQGSSPAVWRFAIWDDIDNRWENFHITNYGPNQKMRCVVAGGWAGDTQTAVGSTYPGTAEIYDLSVLDTELNPPDYWVDLPAYSTLSDDNKVYNWWAGYHLETDDAGDFLRFYTIFP